MLHPSFGRDIPSRHLGSPFEHGSSVLFTPEISCRIACIVSVSKPGSHKLSSRFNSMHARLAFNSASTACFLAKSALIFAALEHSAALKTACTVQLVSTHALNYQISNHTSATSRPRRWSPESSPMEMTWSRILCITFVASC